MAWWSFLFLGAGRRSSARLAKERLQAVVLQQRANTRPPRVPDYLPALQRELQLVVAKYVAVQPREVAVRFAQPRYAPQGLEVRIELPRAARA